MQNSTNSGIYHNDAQPKKAYQAPTLTNYGTVEQFTQNGPAGNDDGGANASS